MDPVNKDGYTPIYIASEKRMDRVMKVLFVHEASTSKVQPNGKTAFQVAQRDAAWRFIRIFNPNYRFE